VGIPAGTLEVWDTAGRYTAARGSGSDSVTAVASFVAADVTVTDEVTAPARTARTRYV
jgi:hypothetical protein